MSNAHDKESLCDEINNARASLKYPESSIIHLGRDSEVSAILDIKLSLLKVIQYILEALISVSAIGVKIQKCIRILDA